MKQSLRLHTRLVPNLEGTDAQNIKSDMNAQCLTQFDTVELVLILHWPMQLDSHLTQVKVFIMTSAGFEGGPERSAIKENFTVFKRKTVKNPHNLTEH